MTTQDVLNKYFKDDKIKYFQSSDSHKSIEGDTYLMYRKTGNIEIWIGGNSGEFCLCSTLNPEKLEEVIKAIMY